VIETVYWVRKITRRSDMGRTRAPMMRCGDSPVNQWTMLFTNLNGFVAEILAPIICRDGRDA